MNDDEREWSFPEDAMPLTPWQSKGYQSLLVKKDASERNPLQFLATHGEWNSCVHFYFLQNPNGKKKIVISPQGQGEWKRGRETIFWKLDSWRKCGYLLPRLERAKISAGVGGGWGVGGGGNCPWGRTSVILSTRFPWKWRYRWG